MLPWQPLFTSSLKNYNFSEVSFTFLYHYFSCSFIDFSYFLVNFGKFQKFWKNQEIQDSGSKMAATLEPDVNVTSYGVISLCCGPQRRHFWMYYLLSKFRCDSFNILRVMRWGPNQPPPPRSQKTKKKPGLNRVKSQLCLARDMTTQKKI